MNIRRIATIISAVTLLTCGVAHADNLAASSTGSTKARPSGFDFGSLGSDSGLFTPPNPPTSFTRVVSVQNFSDRDLIAAFASGDTAAPDLKGKRTVIVIGDGNDFSFRYQDSVYGLPIINGVNLRVYTNRTRGVSASCDADILSLFTCTVHPETVEGQPSYAFEISPK